MGIPEKFEKGWNSDSRQPLKILENFPGIFQKFVKSQAFSRILKKIEDLACSPEFSEIISHGKLVNSPGLIAYSQ